MMPVSRKRFFKQGGGSRKHKIYVLDIVTESYDNINNNRYTGLVLVDLKKAFDTFCHNTLLNKLDHYGIRGPTLKLLTSYLTRLQVVSIK